MMMMMLLLMIRFILGPIWMRLVSACVHFRWWSVVLVGPGDGGEPTAVVEAADGSGGDDLSRVVSGHGAAGWFRSTSKGVQICSGQKWSTSALISVRVRVKPGQLQSKSVNAGQQKSTQSNQVDSVNSACRHEDSVAFLRQGTVGIGEP
ncbi:hypothetical protein HanXRQr2_Chr08g0349261 [Helianthus annuus]|uniref:Secreted protein n=1 Tax=Helianthus annuus TaxID=4232 RepID=A0A251U943_HELAN|nr:hypothetical protein HanXRQr2_Chr08g0349261 [Helianthus annuus]KAJ0902484.1 hypothetical protein HanPSC8_Chr08g0337591 [Helianthus annuus]